MNRVIDLKKQQSAAPSQETESKPRRTFSRPIPGPQRVPAPEPIPESQPVAPQVTFVAAPVEVIDSLSWEAVELSAHPRVFFISLGVVVATALLFSVIIRDVMSALVFWLIALMLLLYRERGNRTFQVEIGPTSVVVNDEGYPLRELKSFWVDYVPGGHKELVLESYRWYTPLIRVPLGEQDPIEVRELLATNLPEHEHERSLVEMLLHRWGL